MGSGYGVGYLRSMKVVCYSLRVSRNVVLLVILKAVVDGIGCWAKMGFITECGRLTIVEHPEDWLLELRSAECVL